MKIIENIEVSKESLFGSVFKGDCSKIFNHVQELYRKMKPKRKIFNPTSPASQHILDLMAGGHSLGQCLQEMDQFYKEPKNQYRTMHRALSLGFGLYLFKKLDVQKQEDKIIFENILKDLLRAYPRHWMDIRRWRQSRESLELIQRVGLFLEQRETCFDDWRRLHSAVGHYLSDPKNYFKRLWHIIIQKIVLIRPIRYRTEQEGVDQFSLLLRERLESRIISKLLMVVQDRFCFFRKIFRIGVLNTSQKRMLINNLLLREDVENIRGVHNLYYYVQQGRNLNNVADITVDNWREQLSHDYGWGRIQYNIRVMANFLAETYRDYLPFISEPHFELLAQVGAYRVVRFFYHNDLTLQNNLTLRIDRAVREAEWKGNDDNTIECYGHELSAAAFFINSLPLLSNGPEPRTHAVNQR